MRPVNLASSTTPGNSANTDDSSIYPSDAPRHFDRPRHPQRNRRTLRPQTFYPEGICIGVGDYRSTTGGKKHRRTFIFLTVLLPEPDLFSTISKTSPYDNLRKRACRPIGATLSGTAATANDRQTDGDRRDRLFPLQKPFRYANTSTLWSVQDAKRWMPCGRPPKNSPALTNTSASACTITRISTSANHPVHPPMTGNIIIENHQGRAVEIHIEGIIGTPERDSSPRTHSNAATYARFRQQLESCRPYGLRN